MEARVYSSRWCRCLETARLLDLGPLEPLPAIDSFFQQPEPRAARPRSDRQFLAELPAGSPLALVTHQVNITALTGEFTASGSGVVARILPDGSLQNLGVLR